MLLRVEFKVQIFNFLFLKQYLILQVVFFIFNQRYFIKQLINHIIFGFENILKILQFVVHLSELLWMDDLQISVHILNFFLNSHILIIQILDLILELSFSFSELFILIAQKLLLFFHFYIVLVMLLQDIIFKLLSVKFFHQLIVIWCHQIHPAKITFGISGMWHCYRIDNHLFLISLLLISFIVYYITFYIRLFSISIKLFIILLY